MFTPLSSLLVCLLLLSPGLAQRRLRNSLMTGRFLYKAQPEDLEMWTKYLELHSVPLTEELLSQGKCPLRRARSLCPLQDM